MTRISDKGAYPVKENVSEEDFVIGTDSESEDKETVTFELGSIVGLVEQSGKFLDKETIVPQTVAGEVEFLSDITVPTGSVILGKDGARISTAGRALLFNDARERPALYAEYHYDDTGSTEPTYWLFGSLIPKAYASPDNDGTIFQSPSEMTFVGAGGNTMTHSFWLTPATTGILRVQSWEGLDDTGAVLIDSLFPIGVGALNTELEIMLPAPVITESGDLQFVRFTGVDLYGAVQSSGLFIGQSVPKLASNVQLLTKETIGQQDLSGYVLKAGDTLTGNIVMSNDGETVYQRVDETIAGRISPDEQDQYGFIVGGRDEEDNFTNMFLAGSNVYIGDDNQFLSNKAAVPYGYLKLAGTPVVDDDGREFYPLAFQQIEQELYTEEYSNTDDFTISSGAVFTILTTPGLANPYSEPGSFEYSFVLDETNKKSTTVNYWFEVNAVPTEIRSTVVGGKTTVTVTGSSEITQNIALGSVIVLKVQATETGGGRITRVLGSTAPTTVKLRKLGYGVYTQDAVNVLGATGITTEPTNNGAIIYLDPTAGNIIEILASAKEYQGKTFTLKRVTNGANYISLSPAAGEFIDDVDDTQSIVLGLANDVMSIHSNGTNWSISQRATVCWGTMKRTGGIGTQAITTSWTKLDLFDTDIFSTAGRLTSDQANDQILIDSLEGAVDGYRVNFYASIEFSSNQDVEFCIYNNGVATDLCGIQTGRGNRYVPISFGHTIGVFATGEIEVYVKASQNGNLKIDTMGIEIKNVKG